MDLFLRDAEKLIGRFAVLVREYLAQGALDDADAGDVTLSQVLALRYVKRHDPAFVGELSTALGISPPAATKAVERLVGKGLVDRREDPDDRRQHPLTITRQGQDLLDRLDKGEAERLSNVLSRMTDSDQKALIRGLRGFMTATFLLQHDLIAKTCERCGSACFESCVINQAHWALHGSNIQPV